MSAIGVNYCLKSFDFIGVSVDRLVFANMNEQSSLERAIKAALECNPKAINRTRIRKRFSEEYIAAEFIEQLECEDLGLLKDKWMARV